MATAHRDDVTEHDWVCPACIHRQHGQCERACTFCGSACLCVCNRWPIPVVSA